LAATLKSGKIDVCSIKKKLNEKTAKIAEFFYWKLALIGGYRFEGQNVEDCCFSSFMQPIIYYLLKY
jgi:hypothetical protein